VNRHHAVALPKPQRREKTRNAEHMVEMAVGQQDPVERSEAYAASEQLALGALTTIDQDAMAAG
jgi:hypothetical protein